MKSSYLEHAMRNGAVVHIEAIGENFMASAEWKKLGISTRGRVRVTVEAAMESLDSAVCEDWTNEVSKHAT